MSNAKRSSAEGVGIPEASEQLGIAAATARTQLKSIFQKTSTKKQSQLARLIANHATGFPQ
jgi:DNA-binding CsgD family transcriptional regulator